MNFEIKADELEQNFFSNIKPSFGLLRKMNFQIPPLSEFCFWDNIKNSDYAKKYIEECFDYLLLNCSIIKAANPPSASQDSSIIHETASAMKSVLLSLIHITTFYKNKSSRSKSQEKDKSSQDNDFIPQINPLENKASIIIKNSSFPQIRKVIEFTINQLFNEPINIVTDIPSMTNYIKTLIDYPCKELKATRFFNTLLLFHRLKHDNITKKLFYPTILELLKSKLKISSNSVKLSESLRILFQLLYLYYLVMSIHPELSNHLHLFLPFLNSRITNSNPFSQWCFRLHSTTKKEIDYPGYCFHQMLEYASNISPMTNNTITIFFDFQNKLFPSMLYTRENDKMSFKLSFIDYVNYYLRKNLGVDEEQIKRLSVTDLLRIFPMIKFTKKDDSKILKEFKLKSSKVSSKGKKEENEEEDKNEEDENDNEKAKETKNGENDQEKDDKDEKIPTPPYIPFSLVRIQPNLYLNPENLIMMQNIKIDNINNTKPSINEEQEKQRELREKRKRSQTRKKGKDENFEESYNDKKNLNDESERYMYNCVLHKVYLDNVFKPIFEYLKENEDMRDEVINHKILVCGNDSAMGKLLMFHLISSLQTDPSAKAAGLIKNLNIEILNNVNLFFYIFPFKNASCNTQLSNFLAAIDPIYDKFVKNVYDLTSHIAPTLNEASNVSFIPIEENTGNEIQKKIEAPKPVQPPPPTTEQEQTEEKSDKEEEEENQNQDQSQLQKPSEIVLEIQNENELEERKETSNENSQNIDTIINNTADQQEQEQENNQNKGLNKFDNDDLITCNPTPSSMLQLAIQHFILFAREHVDVLVWSCVIYMNQKKVVIPFVSGVRFGFTSGTSSSSFSQGGAQSTTSSTSNANNNNNNNNQNEEIKPKKLIIETIDSNNQLSDSQKVKLVSFSIWNSNMDLNCDPRKPILLKEVCYNVNAHSQLIQRENIRANGSFSYASNRLSLIDSQEKKGKKKLAVNTNVIPSIGQIQPMNSPLSSEKVQQQQTANSPTVSDANIGLGDEKEKNLQNVDSEGNVAESNSCIIDLNDENKKYQRVTKKMRDNWAKLSFPKNEQSGIEQNLKVYTNEFIKGITVSVDKDQPPISILVDGVEYEQVKKFQIEPMIDPANGVDQMKIRLACFSST